MAPSNGASRVVESGREAQVADHDSSDTARSSTPPTPRLNPNAYPAESSPHTHTHSHAGLRFQQNHRSALRPNVNSRTNSTGKIKIVTNQTARPTTHRAFSASMTSPTAASPKTSHVKRNNSAFMTRATVSALKKNQSSGHLPKHGSSKALHKQTRVAAPAMKRSRSSKSDNSQKSPIEPQHTVRFDLGMEGPKVGPESDNEWTEDSTSISPETTREHTRQNSIILDPSNVLGITQTEEPNEYEDETPTTETPNKPQRSSSSVNVISADAITSRLLLRSTQKDSHPVTSLSNFVASSNPSSYIHIQTHESPLNESASSGGPNVISRFTNGGSSGGTPADHLAVPKKPVVFVTSPSPDGGHSTESYLQANTKPRRSRSPSAVVGQSVLQSHVRPGQQELPPSRTQQRLELERLSTVHEASAKHHVPSMTGQRHSATLLYSSGLNPFSVGFGGDSDGHGGAGTKNAQLQGLFTQISREYEVVGRFRRPLEEALARKAVTKNGAGISGVKGKNVRSRATSKDMTATTSGVNGHQANSAALGSTPTRSSKSRTETSRTHSPPLESSADRARKRQVRVSFEMPPRTITTSSPNEGRDQRHANQDQDDEYEGDEREYEEEGEEISLARSRHRSERDAVMEMCRRMWDLSAVDEDGESFER